MFRFPELQDFKRYAEEFEKIFNDFSKDVEKERIRAISTQNLLKTIAKQRQAEQQIFQVLFYYNSYERINKNKFNLLLEPNS